VAIDPRTPVLVGAGQVTERPDTSVALERRPEPTELMARALEAAAEDCGGRGAGRRLLDRAGSLRVMLPLSWHYLNPGLLVSARLGLEIKELALTDIGGNNPQTVASLTSLAIARGELDVALLAGADCIFTRIAARRDPSHPTLLWTTQPSDSPEPVRLGKDRRPVTDFERERGLDRPTHVYPLFETALGAAAAEDPASHRHKMARLWARFSEVAAHNPHAWSARARTAEEIATVGPANRMICFPYPKLLNANDRVDQGAAIILCSVEAARAARVPEDRWVFPLAGSDAHDHWFLSERADLCSSPALATIGRHALGLAGLGIDDVGHLDLYSCFPSAVQIAIRELGIRVEDDSRPLTVTGGLTFAGGPGNNYVSHSLATMAGVLRADPGSVGLVTGMGWYVTKHAIGLWSTTPPPVGFRHDNPQPEVDALERRPVAPDAEGDVTVETYTVVHGSSGRPERAILALLTKEGARTWGTVDDPDALAGLELEDGCGGKARLGRDGRAVLR
jgi:acetyl-CoA C-acetyltransferase